MNDIIWNIILPIIIVIASNTFYNICMKSTPSDVNPFAALMITYIVAFVISMVIFILTSKSSDLLFELSKINLASLILAFALVGLEVGYIFVYRVGWKVSNASVVANIGLACVLLVIGWWLYGEDVHIRQILGIFVCMIGLILISY